MSDPALDWDHLRIFLAVMRAPSLRQAADKLGVSHPTIRRRLEALESSLGLQLFDRRSDGLHATTAAAELLDTAERVEASVHALRRRALDADPELRGLVRVTMPDALATDLLMPELIAFCERHPQIELELLTSYELSNLDSREADVAIRAMPLGKPPAEHLAGRLASTACRAIYGGPSQAAPSQVLPSRWIGQTGEAEDRSRVADTPFPTLPIRGRFNDPLVQRAAAAAGFGLVILPCFLGDGVLERLTEPEPAFDIWVLVHPDLRRSPRLRVFRDEIVAALDRLQPRLEGRAHASCSG